MIYKILFLTFLLLISGCSSSGIYGTFSDSQNNFVWIEDSTVKRITINVNSLTSQQKIDAKGSWPIENNKFTFSAAGIKGTGTITEESITIHYDSSSKKGTITLKKDQ